MKTNVHQIKRRLSQCLSSRHLMAVLLLVLLIGTTGCGKEKPEVYGDCEDIAAQSTAAPVINFAYDHPTLRRLNKCLDDQGTICYYRETEKNLWFECL